MLHRKLCTIVILSLVLLNLIKCNRISSISGKLRKRDLDLSSFTFDWDTFNVFLKPLAIKRVAGSPEIIVVKDYIANQMKNYGWIIEYDDFVDDTPFGMKNFSNIIATLPIGKTYKNINKSDAEAFNVHHLNNRVVFACHFDSKYFDDIEFIGAIDSAVPCAMMLEMAKYLQEILPNEPTIPNLERHLQFMFFDGEEAFKTWTKTDSLYGSRHYAKILNENFTKKAFDTMDLFVLFDLIGGQESKFLNYYAQTSHVYNLMSKIENILIKKNMLTRKSPYYFTDLDGYNGQYSHVDDDHRPFYDKGVPVLHLIPSPFPKQWHKKTDTVENLDKNNIKDLRLIFKYFLLEVLHPSKKTSRKEEYDL